MTNMSGTFLNSGACDAGPQGEGKESPSNAGPTHTAGSGKYQPYPDYKDSDVEWLGEVPSDWVLQRLKFLCHITTGDKDTVEREEEGLSLDQILIPCAIRSLAARKPSSLLC
ncbi:hypothetical protein, partial [Aeromonas sp. QDB06]|uniref:hypothetical protein n=1 Tax=unclassified Aeromonas TaxID=257493 RepID=UPI003FA4639F